MNDGASMAHGDVIILYSNDVICKGNFLPELDAEFAKDDRILIGNEVIWARTGWNTFVSRHKEIVVPYVNGYFLACTKETWKLIKFDPIYGKACFEDVDISMQAQVLGYKLVALNSKFLYHIGAQTAKYSDERYRITEENKKKFEAKWKEELEK
jgi:GT2 family glycosyltransferase